jgi:hypothetical protein
LRRQAGQPGFGAAEDKKRGALQDRNAARAAYVRRLPFFQAPLSTIEASIP